MRTSVLLARVVVTSLALACGSFGTSTAATLLRGWVTVPSGGQDAPVGLTVDDAGNCYVTMLFTKAVLKFDADGVKLLEWGGSWGNPEWFSLSGNPDIGPDGLIYCSDEYQVQVFSPEGVLIRAIGGELSTGPQLARTTAVAIRDDGTLLVCDPDNRRIVELTPEGAFIRAWGPDGTDGSQFATPIAIDTDASGNLYVVDIESNLVHKFTSQAQPLVTWGGPGSGNGQFNEPMDLAIDGAGRVYVTDHENHRVQVFDGSGTFLTSWGEMGSAPGQFRHPSGIAIDSNGQIYVAETGNGRIQVFTDAVAVQPASWSAIKRLGSR